MNSSRSPDTRKHAQTVLRTAEKMETFGVCVYASYVMGWEKPATLLNSHIHYITAIDQT